MALNGLCGKYWRPVYAFARHRGFGPEDAEDASQEFFCRLIERGYLERADRSRGKFRAFLVHDFKLFLAKCVERKNALKRGGGVTHLSLDVTGAEAVLDLPGRGAMDPETYFDRQWALEMVRHARESVKQSYEGQGKGKLYELLREGLTKVPDAEIYTRWSESLGMSEGSLRVALHRLRERFRAAMEAQIMETVTNRDDLKAEMRHLRNALGEASAT